MAEAIRNLALVHLERHPEEAARELERGSRSEAAAFLRNAPPTVAARVLAFVSPRFAAGCLAALPAEEQAAALEASAPTTAAAMLRPCPGDVREAALASLSEAAAGSIRSALAFPRGSAGASAVVDAVTLFEDLPVERALEILWDRRDDVPCRALVLSRSRRVRGALRTPNLWWAPRNRAVGSLPLEALRVVPAATPIAALADDRIPIEIPLPVVDRAGAFVGVLNPRALSRIARPDSSRPSARFVADFSELCWFGLTAAMDGLTARSRPAGSGRPRG